MSMLNRSRSAENLKKRDHIVYDKSWNLRLSHIMGVYSRYWDSTSQYKALQMLNVALAFIQNDKQNRLHYNKQKEELDYQAMMDFNEQVELFRALFGTANIDQKDVQDEHLGIIRQLSMMERSEKRWDGEAMTEYQKLVDRAKVLEQMGRFNYMDLRAISMPEPKEDKVYIGREVPLVLVWGNRPAAYVAFRVGYYYEVAVPKDVGGGMIFMVTEKIPMLDWSDPAIVNYMTNCVPYSYWIRQRTMLMNDIMNVAFPLETTIAQYLHNEGFGDFTARKRQAVVDDSEMVAGQEQMLDESDAINT